MGASLATSGHHPGRPPGLGIWRRASFAAAQILVAPGSSWRPPEPAWAPPGPPQGSPGSAQARCFIWRPSPGIAPRAALGSWEELSWGACSGRGTRGRFSGKRWMCDDACSGRIIRPRWRPCPLPVCWLSGGASCRTGSRGGRGAVTAHALGRGTRGCRGPISQMASVGSRSGAHTGATLWSVVEACALGVPESKQLALSLWFFKRRFRLNIFKNQFVKKKLRGGHRRATGSSDLSEILIS